MPPLRTTLSDITPMPSNPLCTPAPLPTVEQLIKTAIRPNDIFHLVPKPCVHSIVPLLIRIIRAAAAASAATDVHTALLHLHMLPSVVLRKSFRGERGWRSSLGQMHALRRRVARAGRGE